MALMDEIEEKLCKFSNLRISEQLDWNDNTVKLRPAYWGNFDRKLLEVILVTKGSGYFAIYHDDEGNMWCSNTQDQLESVRIMNCHGRLSMLNGVDLLSFVRKYHLIPLVMKNEIPVFNFINDLLQ